MWFLKKKKESPKVGKIVAITVAAVTGACAVAYFIYKLILKLKADRYDEECVCDNCPLADECVDGSLCEDKETEEAEEATEVTEEASVDAVEAPEAPAAE